MSHGHGFNRQQRHDGRGDEECRRHPHSLAASQQQKFQKDQQRDHEEQDKGAAVENLRDKNGEDASHHHHGNKGETLLDADGSARAQELNRKHCRQEGKSQPSTSPSVRLTAAANAILKTSRLCLAGLFGR